MLIPFLPYLLAIAGVSAVLALPAAAAETPGWALLALYLVLPLLGAILGDLPGRWLGARSPGLLRRRLLFLAGWLALLALLPLPAYLRAELGWTGDGDAAAVVLLLLNFWLGDTLAVCPLNPFLRETWPAQWRQFRRALRLPVPILLLMLAGLALPVLSDSLLLASAPGSALLAWLRLLGGLAGMLALAAVAVPVLIRVCWGLRPLPDSAAATIVQEELAANGVRVGAVLAWPDDLMGHATAGVIGLLPRFRYLLISPSLLAALEPAELRSVTAHEAGHVKHRHLWYFFAAIVSFILLMQVLATVLFWAGLFTGGAAPLWLMLTLEVGGLLLFFRFGLGFVSRQFERQADGNALRRLGPLPFEGAILKVGLLNGIALEQDNWHHYGIARRIRYAHTAHAEPERLARHDRVVRRVKILLLSLVGVGLSVQAAASNPDAMGWLGEQYLARHLAADAEPTRADLLPLQYLATRAVERGDHGTAERYFRLVLRITPEDPQAQNNLAWVLVTQPNPQAGELQEGLRLAEQAAQAEARAYIWDTLAESHFRLRHYDAAIKAAGHALLLAEEGAGRGDVPLRYYRDRLAAFARHGQGA